jgi:L-rhamnonate dehydratase
VLSRDIIVSVTASVVAFPKSTVEEASPDAPEDVRDWRRGKVANPMTKYAEFRDSRPSATGRDSGRTIVVQVESASGEIGIGITNGGVASAALVELHLADIVEGQSAFAHEAISDRMFNSTLQYGRKGIILHAISAVDLAIWDLHGRLVGQPVYELLGGPIHASLPMYATGPLAGPIEKLGFYGAKLPLTYGPSEGEEGFRRNVERARRAREAVADDFPLYFDCWMSLNVDYAVRLAEAVEPLGFRWLEEPLKPDDYLGHAELRRRMPGAMTLNTGEHEYTAAGFRLLCEAGVDIIQPDPMWCGGMTEMKRIAAVASAYGKRIIPHVGGAYSYHFLTAYPESTFVEFPVMTGDCDTIVPFLAPLLLGEPLPVDGRITPTTAPGFGLELNPEFTLLRPVTRESLQAYA